MGAVRRMRGVIGFLGIRRRGCLVTGNWRVDEARTVEAASTFTSFTSLTSVTSSLLSSALICGVDASEADVVVVVVVETAVLTLRRVAGATSIGSALTFSLPPLPF